MIPIKNKIKSFRSFADDKTAKSLLVKAPNTNLPDEKKRHLNHLKTSVPKSGRRGAKKNSRIGNAYKHVYIHTCIHVIHNPEQTK